MTKLCQQYLSDVKSLFPIMGKPEKKYLSKLREPLEDYCREEQVSTMEEIYDNFGQPDEVVNNYLRSADTAYLIKRIRLSKWVKRGFIALLLIALIGVSIAGIYMHKEYTIYKQEQLHHEETILSD